MGDKDVGIAILDEIAKAWGWKGVQPHALISENAFGNVIFADMKGSYWRIRPEALSCDLIALDPQQYQRLLQSEEFQIDWNMDAAVALAHAAVGPLTEGRCYCLKTASVLGGQYCSDNIGTISRPEAVSFSGFVAEKIKDLPDGAKIKLRIVNKPAP